MDYKSAYRSTLRKALTSDTASGLALIPEDLEPLIRANLFVKSPLARMVPLVKADSNLHKVVRRTANIAGWVEGEMTVPSFSSSTYGRRQVEMKIMRTHGQASDFQVTASKSFTDVLADEIESATDGMAMLFEYLSLWGQSDDLTTRAFTGDPYQYTGVFGWLLEDAYATNVIDPDATITLSFLDNALDITAMKYQNVSDVQYVWIMSPQMISKISGLQTLLRREAPRVEFEGGFVMETYRNIPILPSGYVKPASTTTSPATICTPHGGTGWPAGDGTYRYKISSVTLNGEQAAGTMATAALATAAQDYNVVTWVADTTAKLYMIWRTAAGEGDDDDNYDLIDIIPAKTYGATGDVTGNLATYTDYGLKAQLNTVHPLTTLEENIFLVALGKNQGIARPVLTPVDGEPIDSLISYVPVVANTDSVQFRLKSYHALQVPWGQLHAIVRRAAIA